MGQVLGRIAVAGHLPIHQVQRPELAVDDEVAGVDFGVDDTGPGILLEEPFLHPGEIGPGLELLQIKYILSLERQAYCLA